jgi:hypothetical protein
VFLIVYLVLLKFGSEIFGSDAKVIYYSSYLFIVYWGIGKILKPFDLVYILN